MTAYVKTIKVIHSCRTAEHIKVAEKFFELASTYCNRIEVLILSQELQHKKNNHENIKSSKHIE